jgi:hypothetical protein
MAIAAGRIRGVPAVALVQDFSFMGGSLGVAAGEGFIAAARAAVKREAPLVAFTASGGARMQEGTLSLMQLARTTLAIQELKDARLPYLVVLTDPTTGGVTASYAMLGDVHLAEPGALIGFAGPRRDRADHPREAAAGLPALRVPPGQGHGRQGRGAEGPPRDAGPDPGRADGRPRQGQRRLTDQLRPHDAALLRLKSLHPLQIDLSLDRILRLLEALGRPQDRLPPVIHVAGTNGKGSTVAFARAIAEAAACAPTSSPLPTSCASPSGSGWRAP